VNGFTDWGIYFQAYYPAYWTHAPTVAPVVTDADISSVHRPVRGASDGTAESGLWAGAGCLCARIRVRDTGWSGVETAGNVNGGVFKDLDIGDVHGTVPAGGPGRAGAPAGVGIYVEHYTRRTVFRRVHVHAGGGVKPRIGLHAEWADPAYAGTNPENPFVGAAFDVTVENSLFDTSHDGIYLSDSTRSVIRRNRFEGQRYAGVRDYMSPGYGHSTTLRRNTFAMQAGALVYTRVPSGNVPGYVP
jgi:parallel beta-helix repeat protein